MRPVFGLFPSFSSHAGGMGRRRRSRQLEWLRLRPTRWATVWRPREGKAGTHVGLRLQERRGAPLRANLRRHPNLGAHILRRLRNLLFEASLRAGHGCSTHLSSNFPDNAGSPSGQVPPGRPGSGGLRLHLGPQLHAHEPGLVPARHAATRAPTEAGPLRDEVATPPEQPRAVGPPRACLGASSGARVALDLGPVVFSPVFLGEGGRRRQRDSIPHLFGCASLSVAWGSEETPRKSFRFAR